MDTASVPAICPYCNTEIPPLLPAMQYNFSHTTFGRVHVNHFHSRHRHLKHYVYYWCCICECGKQNWIVSSRNFYKPSYESCGCKRFEDTAKRLTKHGMYRTKMHKRWRSMIQRCINPHGANYHLYGGRGITVCDRWLTSFEAFYTDMGEPPAPGMSIDRIDPNGPYSPENCRWATPKQQNRNMRSNHLLTYNGESLSIAEWAERLGVPANCLHWRLRHGWSVEEIVTIPSTRSHRTSRNESRYISWDGKILTPKGWEAITGVNAITIAGRLRSGWSVEEALTIPAYKGRNKREI